MTVARCKVLAIEIKVDRKNWSSIVFDIDEFTLFVQAVDAAQISVLPTNCNLEAFVTKLNVSHWRLFRSIQLNSSFLSPYVVNVDNSVYEADCKN